jgi:hypothetical protein
VVGLDQASISRRAGALTNHFRVGALSLAALQIALERVEDALVTIKIANS